MELEKMKEPETGYHAHKRCAILHATWPVKCYYLNMVTEDNEYGHNAYNTAFVFTRAQQLTMYGIRNSDKISFAWANINQDYGFGVVS